MTQLVRAYGQILRFPKEMSDEAISKAILDNEHDLNPDYSPPASSKVKDLAKEYLGVDVDQVSKKISDSRKSVADLAADSSARGEDTAAPQVPGAPVRQSTYNSALLNDRFGIKPQESLDQNRILGRIKKTADEDIRGQEFQENLRGAITDAPPEPEGGFIPSAASIAGRTIKGVGRVGSDYLGYDTNNSISAYGQKLIDENPVAIRGLEDIQDRPFLAVKEALGNSAPTMGGMVGAKAFGMGITSLAPLTGPAAPIIAAVGQAVQWLGPAAIAALPSYSGIRDKQILNDPANEADGKAKAIAALGAGTVGVIEQAFGPQQWAMAMLTKEGRSVLARKFAATTTLGAISKGVIKGSTIEGSEEIIQSPVEQLASFDDPTTKENIKETIFGGAMGAIGGGVMGGGIGGINQIARNRDAQILIEKRKLAKQHADAVNRRNAQQGHDDILNAGSVDDAIKAANESVSRNPVTKDDVLRTVDPTLADIERLTGLKPSESIEQAINQAQQDLNTESIPMQGQQANVAQNVDIAAQQKGKVYEEEASQTPSTKKSTRVLGNSTEIVLPDNTTLPAQWEIVSADSIKAALKEGVNQPRDRTRASSDIQIQEISNNLDYRRLSDSPVLDIGAPAISHDGLIVAGNGRFEAVSLAHDKGMASDYLDALKNDAVNKGIDPAVIEGMKKPVLVRRITQPYDVRKLGIYSNAGTSLQYSGMELAKIDAERMKGIEDIDITDAGDIALTGSNISKLKQSLGDYNNTELASLIDKNGALSQDGVRRVRNSLLAKAYGDSDTLGRLVEPTDNDARNVLGALTRSAGVVAKVRSDIKAGALPKELDITNSLLDAVETLSQIRAKGQPLEQYLAQDNLFGDDIDADSKEILKFLHDNVRSQKKLTAFIKDVYGQISNIDQSTEDIFGDNAIPSKQDVIQNAKQSTASQATEQQDIFAKQPGQANEQAAKVKASDVGGGKEAQSDTGLKFSRSPEERIKDRERSRQLESKLREQGYNFTIKAKDVRDFAAMDRGRQNEAAAAEQIAGNFGKRVVWIEAIGDFKINGVMIPSIKDTIFIDVTTDKYASAVMGHELSHHMERDAPDVYKELVKSLESLIRNNDEYADTYDIKGADKDYITKEIVGDLVGDNFTDQEFWNKVAEYNPSAFRKIADTIISWLKNLVVKAKSRGLGSERWVTDVLEAQDIIAKAVAQYTNKESSFADEDVSIAAKSSRAGSQKITLGSFGDFKTGSPVTFNYLHNKESATSLFGKPTKESKFGRQYEPSGKYVINVSDNTIAKQDPNKYEYGELSFNNPLVIDNNNLEWEKELSDAYGGKTGKQLSKALIADGYDGVVTVDKYGASEILDLTSFDESTAKFSKAEQNYRMEHKSPGREENAPLSDLTGDGLIYPDDVYSNKAVQYYGTGNDKMDRQSFEKARIFRGKPDAIIEIYRAVPKDASAREINSGDWVTINRNYAKEHGESYFDGNYDILSKKVRAGDIFTNGDSIHEWGYEPEIENKFSKAESIPETINIDGVDRPTRNSKGKLIHPNENGIRNFYEWFGDSKVTDEQGRPKVVYHGTMKQFNKINVKKGAQGIFWFSSDKESIESGRSGAASTRTIMPLYVKIVNPAGWKQYDNLLLDEFKSKGLDGAILPRGEDNFDGFILNKLQVKSAEKNTGTFSNESDDIRFSRAEEQKEPLMPESKFRKFQRLWQDDFNRFVAMKEWLSDRGINLSEQADVSRAEERYHSKVANQIEDFNDFVAKPLIEKIAKSGFTMSDVADYLEAQHAEEANDIIAKLHKDPSMTAYGITNDEAEGYLSKAPKELGVLANEFRNITEKTKKLLLDEGLRSQEEIDAWEAAYKHYIPVKGGDQPTKGTGKGLSVNSKTKRRLGHGRRDEAVIENILLDYNRAVIEVEKNRIAKHLGMMAAEIAMPKLMTIGQPVKRNVLKNAVAYEVQVKGVIRAVFDSRESANVFKQMLPATDKKIAPSEITINPTRDQRIISSASPMLAENEINMYIDGHAIRIQINDEIAARAYKHLGIEGYGHLVAAGRAINGYLSKAYTGYAPEWGITNIIRDFTAGIINLTGEEGIVMAAKAVKNYPGSFASLLGYAFAGRKKSNKWIDMYRANGGNTGAAWLPDMERLSNDVASEYAAFQGVISNLKQGDMANASRAALRKLHNVFLKWLNNLNQASENAMRLAAFRAMIESGKSVNEASHIAKNITINFNKKGEFGQTANAAYLFFNATMNGQAAMNHALFKGRHKYQAWTLGGAGLTALGYTMAAMLGGGDEDEYDKLDDYTKERNMVIKSGDGWIKIPVPYGHGFFWSLGRSIADAQRKDELGTLPWHVAASAIEELTPFGGIVVGSDEEFKSDQVLLGLLPTVAQIAMQPALNKSIFSGGEMMPESPFDKSQPDREKMWRGTKGTMYDKTSGWLKDAGIDVSPETLKHLTRSATGGAGATADAVISAAMLKTQGAEMDANEVPFVRKLYHEPTIRNDRAAFNKAREEAKTAAEEFRRAKRDNDLVSINKILKDKKEMIMLDNYANKLQKYINFERDQQDAAKVDESIPVAERRLKLKLMEARESKFYDKYLDIFKTNKTVMKERLK